MYNYTEPHNLYLHVPLIISNNSIPCLYWPVSVLVCPTDAAVDPVSPQTLSLLLWLCRLTSSEHLTEDAPVWSDSIDRDNTLYTVVH